MKKSTIKKSKMKCTECLNHYEIGHYNKDKKFVMDELKCKLNFPLRNLECSEFKKYLPYYGIKEDTPEWYENFIEKPIQPLVKLLRTNGFDTFSSCGHDMNCYCEYLAEGEIKRLYDLLSKNGYKYFCINVEVTGQNCSRIIIKLPKSNRRIKVEIKKEVSCLDIELNHARNLINRLVYKEIDNKIQKGGIKELELTRKELEHSMEAIVKFWKNKKFRKVFKTFFLT